MTNESQDHIEVYLFGLHFAPGETQDVDDEIAQSLGAPFKVELSAAVQPSSQTAPASGAPAAPVVPSETVEQPADIAAAEAELQQAQEHLKAAEAANETPAAPAAGGNAQ